MLRHYLLARISTYEVAPIGVPALLLKGLRINIAIRRAEVEGLVGAVGIEMVFVELWKGAEGSNRE
jgi:hypothetical protein